jgi:hypothetical protein
LQQRSDMPWRYAWAEMFVPQVNQEATKT